MKENKNIALGKKGMNRDIHPSNLSETEYTEALNTNYEDESGNGYPMLQNEHSNILCTRFKPNYKVVGFKHDLNSDRTYYFLLNTDLNLSEIGFLSNVHNISSIEDIEEDCGCEPYNTLASPLEETIQEETCTYTTLIEDSCNGCLNFSIDYPIKVGNVHIKDEKCGKTLYWTDNYNPQRSLNLDNLEFYKTIGQDSCGEQAPETCIDCNKLRVFPTFEKPCLVPEVIQYGGNLKAGTYEFLVAYCDKQGNEISQYFSITNPVSIFDSNNNILDQTELAYITNYGIKLRVDNLDEKYSYYKIAVIQRTDVNGATTYFEEGVHPVNDQTILYTTDQDKLRVSLNKLLSVKPVYTKAEGMAVSNGYLFQYGLEAEKEMNLQPVVNLMGGFLKWQTVLSDEDLYKDGVNNSLYKSFMRDEVYPFSIRFFTKEGFETSLFPFIARPSLDSENAIVDNKDKDSLDSFSPNCSENDRNKIWQFYNTATVEGVCESNLPQSESVIKPVEKRCSIEDVAEIPPSTVEVSLTEDYLDLETYINQNREEICDVDSEYYNAFLCGYLSDTYTSENCTPNFPDNCDSIVLAEEFIEVQEVEGEQVTEVEKEIDDYVKAIPPSNCNIYERDSNSGGFLRNTDFEREFMVSLEITTSTGTTRVYQPVFDRRNVGSNTSCDYASQLYFIDNPTTALGTPIHLDYTGKNTLPELQTTFDAGSVLSTPTYEFTDKLHIDSLWFKGEIGDRDEFVFEVTKKTECPSGDTIPIGNLIRVNFYNDCGNTTFVHSEIIDLTEGKIIKLDSTLFSSPNILVAVDSPIVRSDSNGSTGGNTTFEINDQPSKYRTAPPCGCFSIFLRDIEFIRLDVTYTSIKLNKTQVYTSNCSFSVPVFDGCKPVPYEYGNFSYWESLENYPDNSQLYDSSLLTIEPEDLPDSIRQDFEDYYTDGDLNNKYILKEATNFACKPIRHYKFPDNTVTPFMTKDIINPFQRSLVYPIGVKIDNEVVNAFLDIAVKSNLISAEKRESIVSYEIFRGDRVLDKSIVSKGLLYDTYRYIEGNKLVYYPNYPYNDLGTDILNYQTESRNNLTPHPYGGNSNNRFTFHSPDTHFNKPSLPSEISIEGFQFGNSRGNFTDVKGHSTWVILGRKAFTTATFLSIAEVAFESVIKIGELVAASAETYRIQVGLANSANPVGIATSNTAIITTAIAYGIDAFMKVGRYRYEWLKIFRDAGQPSQFASYYSSVGYYNSFLPNDTKGEMLRGLATSKYLKSGRYAITEENTGFNLELNNIDRESSVYLSFGEGFNFTYPDFYKNYDNYNSDSNTNSRTTSSASFSCAKGRSREIERNISSPYVSLKNYLPSQYGSVEGIKWLPTSYCGDLRRDNSCEVVFGGDTFISRFSFKRKIPLFLVSAMNQAPLTPFDYLQYRNIGSPRFYADYDTEKETTILNSLFPEITTEYSFDCLSGEGSFYVKPPSKFYLFYYGIPQFLVESEINLNYRYARKELHENFYPNIGDYTEWTQEENVSIKRDNTYYYNNTYSKDTTPLATRMLPSSYDKELYDCLYDAPNGVIYSLQDSSEQDLFDPWLVYKPLDFYQFPTSSGKLIDIQGIESGQIIVRFENKVALYNAIDNLRDRLTNDNQELGSGGIFSNSRVIDYKSTDLGYAGTQHKAMVSCEFGHFWVDSKRGQVFQVDQNGGNLKEITGGLRNWFKLHLPFKFLKNNTENITYSDLDNIFKGIGISMGWDSRFKRVFITKRDYLVKEPIFTNQGKLFRVAERDGIINTYQALGYTYLRIDDSKVIFEREINNEVELIAIDITEIMYNDSRYFEDVSFTLAYNPLSQSWISYYSFKPNYYVSYHNYFQTGLNYSLDPSEEGLWSHLLTNKSYCVFYGKKYDWMIEVPVKENYFNKILNSVTFWMDSRRYQNEFDYAENREIGFDSAVLYNNSNNTGKLNLITQKRNNLNQQLQYPKYNPDGSIDILTTLEDKNWSFNHIFNKVSNELNNVPLWNYDNNQLGKELNQRAFKNNSSIWNDRLRGDWFLLRLSSNKDSRFKQIFKWITTKENAYE